IANQLGFEVYTPAQIAGSWWLESPIGQGTPRQGCETQASNCSPDDLYWNGNFQAGGIYAVRVTNPTSHPVSFVLTISGSSVALCPASSQSLSNPTLSDMAALCTQFSQNQP